MRQNEYRSEKQTYKTREYILKNDKKYKKSHPLEFRFHLFVKLQIISINNNIAMVNHKEISELIQNMSKMIPKIGSLMCHEHHSIIIQNMDSYFFMNDVRKKKMENQLHKYSSFVDFTERSSSARTTSMNDLGFSMPESGSSAPPKVVQGCDLRSLTEKPSL